VTFVGAQHPGFWMGAGMRMMIHSVKIAWARRVLRPYYAPVLALTCRHDL